MLAFFSNLHFTELILIALVGTMVFGRNLPRIVVQIWAQISKARRGMNKVWRETGVHEEIRRMQREVREAEYKVRDAVRQAEDVEEAAEAAGEEGGEEPESFEGAEHDEHYQGEGEGDAMADGEGDPDEPEGEAARRAEPHPGPDPYPGNAD